MVVERDLQGLHRNRDSCSSGTRNFPVVSLPKWPATTVQRIVAIRFRTVH